MHFLFKKRLRPHTPLYRPSSLSHEDLVLEGEFPFRLPERKGVSCSITILPEGTIFTSYFSPCIHANPFHPAPPLIIIRKNFKKTNDVFSIFFLKMHGIEPLRPNSIVEFAYFFKPLCSIPFLKARTTPLHISHVHLFRIYPFVTTRKIAGLTFSYFYVNYVCHETSFHGSSWNRGCDC